MLDLHSLNGLKVSLIPIRPELMPLARVSRPCFPAKKCPTLIPSRQTLSQYSLFIYHFRIWYQLYTYPPYPFKSSSGNLVPSLPTQNPPPLPHHVATRVRSPLERSSSDSHFRLPDFKGEGGDDSFPFVPVSSLCYSYRLDYTKTIGSFPLLLHFTFYCRLFFFFSPIS